MLKCDHSNESYRAELPYFDWCYPVHRPPIFSSNGPSSARNKKQICGVGVGEEENRRYIFFILAFWACSRSRARRSFRKNRKKNFKKVCLQVRSMIKAILTPESHNKILWCNHSNKAFWTILLHHAIKKNKIVIVFLKFHSFSHFKDSTELLELTTDYICFTFTRSNKSE